VVWVWFGVVWGGLGWFGVVRGGLGVVWGWFGGGYAETMNPWMPKLAVLLAAHTIYPKLLTLNCC